MTRDELFSEVRELEDRALSLINDDSRQTEFDEAVRRVAVLTDIAQREGWL